MGLEYLSSPSPAMASEELEPAEFVEERGRGRGREEEEEGEGGEGGGGEEEEEIKVGELVRLKDGGGSEGGSQSD